MADLTLEDLDRRLVRVEELLAPSSLGPAAVPPPVDAPHAPEVGREIGREESFWALEGLRARADGGGRVLATGLVPLPLGGRAEWQEEHDAKELLDDEWAPTAPVLAALGHPVRLRLLREVLHGTTTAAELAALPGVGTTGQVYHHLRQLSGAGWLRPAVGAARGAHEVPVARVVPLLTVLALCRR